MSGRARRLASIAIAVALIAGLAYFVFCRYRDSRPWVIGPLPPGAVLRQTADKSRPWIDLPWFKGRLQFPRPDDLKVDPYIEQDAPAYLVWKEYPDPTNRAGFVRMATWRDEADGEIWVRPAPGLALAPWQVPLPYVYGNQARTFQVSYRWRATNQHFPQHDSFKVQLPPNGLPAPKLPVSKVKVGKWTLVLTPMPAISPSFAPKCLMAIKEAKPADTFMVQIERRVWLKLKGTTPRVFNVPDDFGPVPIIVNRVQEVPVRFSVKRIPSTPGATWDREYQLFLDNKLFADAVALGDNQCFLGRPVQTYKDPGYWIPEPWNVARIGDAWIGADYDNGGNSLYEALCGRRTLISLQDKQVLDGVVYRSIEESVGWLR